MRNVSGDHYCWRQGCLSCEIRLNCIEFLGGPGGVGKTSSRDVLRDLLRNDVDNFENLTSADGPVTIVLNSVEEASRLISKGLLLRMEVETLGNLTSSRTHGQITIEISYKTPDLKASDSSGWEVMYLLCRYAQSKTSKVFFKLLSVQLRPHRNAQCDIA
jgi:hypothetical protein